MRSIYFILQRRKTGNMQFNIKLITVALLGFSSLAHLLPFTITNVGRDTAASLEEELWKRKGSGGGKGGGHSNGKGGSSSSRYVVCLREQRRTTCSHLLQRIQHHDPGHPSPPVFIASWAALSSSSHHHSGNKSNRSSNSSRGKGSPSSSLGGATKQGSGVAPRFGGGRYYGGGATTPYASGVRSPLGYHSYSPPRCSPHPPSGTMDLRRILLSLYPSLLFPQLHSTHQHQRLQPERNEARNLSLRPIPGVLMR
jgi:hypothetical protein